MLKSRRRARCWTPFAEIDSTASRRKNSFAGKAGLKKPPASTRTSIYPALSPKLSEQENNIDGRIAIYG
jgi:hypothetical protein